MFYDNTFGEMVYLFKVYELRSTFHVGPESNSLGAFNSN